MLVEVKAVAEQTEAERAALRALTTAVYPPQPAVAGEHAIEWASPRWGVIARDDDGNVVGFVGIHAREAALDGRAVQVAGIGNVKTHPAVREQGYAGAALRRAAAFMADALGTSFGLLVCREALLAFYGRLGWVQFDGTLLVEQHGATVPFTANLPMVLSLRDPAPRGGQIDLCGTPW